QQVVAAGGAVERHLQADDRGDALVTEGLALLIAQVAAVAVIARWPAGLALLLAQRGQALRRAEALVCVALGQQAVGVFAVQVEPLALEVGAVRAADIRPFVPVQAQPAQRFGDRGDARLVVALLVGILDAQDEGAVVLAGKKVGEERGARAADVQVTGRAGREAHAHWSIVWVRHHSLPSPCYKGNKKRDQGIGTRYEVARAARGAVPRAV